MIYAGGGNRTVQDNTDHRVGLVIGDSIAYGHTSLAEPTANNFAAYLQGLLGFTWVNHGVSGSTTTAWADDTSIASYIADAYRNIALLHIGVNDIYYSVNLATTKLNFKKILDILRNLRYKIIVLSIPYSNRDSASWSQVDDMNAWLMTECAARGVWFVDYSAWSKAQKDNETYYGDTIHPTDAGYVYIGNQILSSVVF